MKRLRVSIDGVGECIINSTSEIKPTSEFAIKALAGLQLMCVNIQNDTKYNEFLSILGDAVDRISGVYEVEDESTDFRKIR